MKILTIHADFIEFKAKKKALKQAEDVDTDKKRAEECLVVFTAVEKRDEANLDSTKEKYMHEIKSIAQQVNTKNIVLYPYAHLSSKLSNPKIAEDLMKQAELELKEQNYEVLRAPFGWYKSFDVACKGHPLSELSREFTGEGEGQESETTELSDKEIKNLLSQISKSRLDTSKLKDNDHRILGKNLDLWSFNEVASGMVFWHHKGLLIKNLLIDYWREVHNKNGYLEISTPQIMDKKLWLLSGHWNKYKENMFITDYEKRHFAVKPMNCPGGMLVYKANPKSYKDLPLRMGELGIVHRQELSGVLAGLFRVIQFTQDDAHIFCTEDQVEDEVSKIIDIVIEMFKTFSLEFDHIELSTRPEKRIGEDRIWDLAENALANVLKKRNIEYKVNEGDGAFYGPKIDFHLKDSLSRSWQCSTIQLDMALPERFDLEYIDKDGSAKRPIMLHRVVYGAIERFIGIMFEHLNGKLPLWISPVQVKVLTINDSHIPFAKEIAKDMEKVGLRIELDDRTESMGKKVREAQLGKVNYIVTIGDKELENKTLAVRNRAGETKFKVNPKEFIKELVEEVEKKEVK
ncbi:threonine--tRNA ligase [archaeon]|jgi:threonyl-tRNA synthetase|nr:threonine--tRNA ligase [archaeon]MBT3450672.1 threonine--tRNA ligase [archaeon]MBT6868748.1 threonine--tRNA ligase [archaeon]MBT7193031.1 threonine--tRNA ligase [archaeon]MBT7380997.1 threonine--tRNA ligase [archaeon]